MTFDASEFRRFQGPQWPFFPVLFPRVLGLINRVNPYRTDPNLTLGCKSKPKQKKQKQQQIDRNRKNLIDLIIYYGYACLRRQARTRSLTIRLDP